MYLHRFGVGDKKRKKMVNCLFLFHQNICAMAYDYASCVIRTIYSYVAPGGLILKYGLDKYYCSMFQRNNR